MIFMTDLHLTLSLKRQTRVSIMQFSCEVFVQTYEIEIKKHKKQNKIVRLSTCLGLTALIASTAF